jgi:RPA family protein
VKRRWEPKGVQPTSVVRLYAEHSLSEMAALLGVTRSDITYQVMKLRSIPERIEKLEAKIKELRALHERFLKAERLKGPRHAHANRNQLQRRADRESAREPSQSHEHLLAKVRELEIELNGLKDDRGWED